MPNRHPQTTKPWREHFPRSQELAAARLRHPSNVAGMTQDPGCTTCGETLAAGPKRITFDQLKSFAPEIAEEVEPLFDGVIPAEPLIEICNGCYGEMTSPSCA